MLLKSDRKNMYEFIFSLVWNTHINEKNDLFSFCRLYSYLVHTFRYFIREEVIKVSFGSTIYNTLKTSRNTNFKNLPMQIVTNVSLLWKKNLLHFLSIYMYFICFCIFWYAFRGFLFIFRFDNSTKMQFFEFFPSDLITALKIRFIWKIFDDKIIQWVYLNFFFSKNMSALAKCNVKQNEELERNSYALKTETQEMKWELRYDDKSAFTCECVINIKVNRRTALFSTAISKKQLQFKTFFTLLFPIFVGCFLRNLRLLFRFDATTVIHILKRKMVVIS